MKRTGAVGWLDSSIDQNTYTSGTRYNVLEQASNDFSILALVGYKASDEHAEERMLRGVERATDRHAPQAGDDGHKRGLHIWVTTWFPAYSSGFKHSCDVIWP